MSSENRFALSASCSRDPACRAPHAASAALLADVRSGKQRPERDARRGHGAAIPGCGLRHRRGGILIDPRPVAGRSAGGKSPALPPPLRHRRCGRGRCRFREKSGADAARRRSVSLPETSRAERPGCLPGAQGGAPGGRDCSMHRKFPPRGLAKKPSKPQRAHAPHSAVRHRRPRRGRAHIRAYLRAADRERAQARRRSAGGKAPLSAFISDCVARQIFLSGSPVPDPCARRMLFAASRSTASGGAIPPYKRLQPLAA
jgi:hypothetical protein